MAEQKLLALPGGRTLAYADAGNTSSSTIVVFFHGMFSIGDARRPSPVLMDMGVHFVTPTLPGWGTSSSPLGSMSYATSLASDITALINHLHPDKNGLKLYICGGSYGTVPAQMLYGASYDDFPLGRNIVAVLIIGPFSPFHCDANYTKSMSWASYLSVGPPSRMLPFKIVPRLTQIVMARRVNTPERAASFIGEILFGKMNESERNLFDQWRESKGLAEGQIEREMGQNVAQSVARTWEGFLDVSNVLHSEWGGFIPNGLDEEHARAPIFICWAKDDDLAPPAWAAYLVENYKNVRTMEIEGGHLAALYHLDEIWAQLMKI